MSKSITIQEGGVGKALSNVRKIKTAEQGGGSVFWVPEEEVQLTTKHISKNGTYKASSDGAYGYSQVTVSGVGKATGIKPGSGTPISEGGNGKDNEYAYVTPQGGGGGSDENIIEKLLPSSIKIITPPSQTEYTEGEDISISGMVVTAYNNDGTVWTDQDHPSGHVELSELTFSPTKAHYEGRTVKKYEGSNVHVDDVTFNRIICEERYNDRASYEEGGPFSKKENPIATVARDGNSGEWYTYCGNTPFRVAYVGNGRFIIASDKPLGGNGDSQYNIGVSAPWGSSDGDVLTLDGKTVYYRVTSYYGRYISESLISASDTISQYESLFAWAMMYGNLRESGGSEITVTWKRPEDEKELSDKFSITVNPDIEGGGGTDSGGGSW